MSEKACYTVRELSSRWGCSRDTVDRMIKTGMLPAYKLIWEWRVSAETVRAYEAGELKPPARERVYKGKREPVMRIV